MAGLAMARGFAHEQGGHHGWQGKHRTDGVGPLPAGRLGDHQCQRAGGHRADAPAVLRHAGTYTQLTRAQQLDAIGVDDDIETGAGHADQDRCLGGGPQTGLGIDQRQIDHGGHHQRPGDPQPGHTLPQMADQRQTHAIDDPGPQELEVVDQEGQ